jgi:RNA polymerase sigma-70 factor (ECF subfamily)
METRADLFASSRPWLFAIAYRMLGSVMDAEDLVQDAFLRWQEAPETEVRSPRAYLTTIVTRLAINRLHSARAQRETYVGPWLPEPLVTDPDPDPEARVELAESLSMAFLVLLERLSPVERAVFLLHEVFDLEYAEIARIVEKSEANCRQLLSRAKKHVHAPRARFDADPARANRLVRRFIEAGQAGDLDGLVAILAEDITLWADGGGKVKGASLEPVTGATQVAKRAMGFARRLVPTGVAVRPAEINGQPGIIASVSGKPVSALVFEIRDGLIRTMYAIGNPDKLAALPSQPDAPPPPAA